MASLIILCYSLQLGAQKIVSTYIHVVLMLVCRFTSLATPLFSGYVKEKETTIAFFWSTDHSSDHCPAISGYTGLVLYVVNPAAGCRALGLFGRWEIGQSPAEKHGVD